MRHRVIAVFVLAFAMQFVGVAFAEENCIKAVASGVSTNGELLFVDGGVFVFLGQDFYNHTHIELLKVQNILDSLVLVEHGRIC